MSLTSLITLPLPFFYPLSLFLPSTYIQHYLSIPQSFLMNDHVYSSRWQNIDIDIGLALPWIGIRADDGIVDEYYQINNIWHTQRII